MTKEELLQRLDNDYTFHPFYADQRVRAKKIMGQTYELAEAMVQHAPVSRELSLALTHLEEAVSLFVSAMVRNESYKE